MSKSARLLLYETNNCVEILEEKVHLWLESARFVKAKSAVYVLYDRKLDVLYVGASDNLQTKFSHYVDTNFDNNACKQKTHTYQRSFMADPKEKKKMLLDEFKEKYGRLPCCNTDAD